MKQTQWTKVCKALKDRIPVRSLLEISSYSTQKGQEPLIQLLPKGRHSVSLRDIFSSFKTLLDRRKRSNVVKGIHLQKDFSVSNKIFEVIILQRCNYMVLFCLGVQDIITFVLPGSFFKITNGSSHKSQRQKEQY